MAGFAGWLHDQPESESNAQLKAFATQNSGIWPYWSDSRKDYADVILGAQLANKDDLLLELGSQHEAWRAKHAGSGAPLTLGEWLRVRLGAIFLAAFGIIIALFLWWGLRDTDFLDSLAKIDQARGLITFLFALGAISVIILIAIATFWIPENEIESRFGKAKELLIIIIGIMGTIIGFYFGTPGTDATSRNASPETSTNGQTKAGKTSDVTAPIHGAAAPYRYSITFGRDDIKVAISGAQSHGGKIAEDVTVPSASKPRAVGLMVVADDSPEPARGSAPKGLPKP